MPDAPGERAVLIAHELYHHLQPRLPMGSPQAGDNAHLDTPDGRYWLQMEWRALARALRAGDDGSRREAIRDALAFRDLRQAAFAGAERDEAALELHEGLAEYTGIAVAGATDRERNEAALRRLAMHAADASFVRSFAYASGPAYGLLLDRHSPGWRARLDGSASLPALLAQAVGNAGGKAGARADAAVDRYDGDRQLREAEQAREQARRERLALHRAKFLAGPVLTLPLKHMDLQFDPRSPQPLDDAGMVYPALRVADDWGVLQVAGGALLRKDWSAVVVVAPTGERSATPLQGEGWTLELAPGWALVPGGRAGDFVLARLPAQAP